MTPRASMLVVAYRRPDLVRECLQSIAAHPPDGAWEAVVVDNAPEERVGTHAREALPGVRVIENPVNVGFAKAANQAAAAATGGVLVFLNPDTRVLPGSLEALVRFVESDPERGLVGGRTLAPDGRVDPQSCWGFPSTWSALCFATGLSRLFRRSRLFDPESLGRWSRDSVQPVGVVTGCLLATTREVWAALGGFDERYFLYGEDLDLSRRAWGRGYRPSITPEAVIVHHVGSSSIDPVDRQVLVLRGRATAVATHARHPRIQAGLTRVGVAGRAAVAALGRRESVWRAVWRERDTALRPYPPEPV